MILINSLLTLTLWQSVYSMQLEQMNVQDW